MDKVRGTTWDWVIYYIFSDDRTPCVDEVEFEGEAKPVD